MEIYFPGGKIDGGGKTWGGGRGKDELDSKMRRQRERRWRCNEAEDEGMMDGWITGWGRTTRRCQRTKEEKDEWMWMRNPKSKEQCLTLEAAESFLFRYSLWIIQCNVVMESQWPAGGANVHRTMNTITCHVWRSIYIKSNQEGFCETHRTRCLCPPGLQTWLCDYLVGDRRHRGDRETETGETEGAVRQIQETQTWDRDREGTVRQKQETEWGLWKREDIYIYI